MESCRGLCPRQTVTPRAALHLGGGLPVPRHCRALRRVLQLVGATAPAPHGEAEAAAAAVAESGSLTPQTSAAAVSYVPTEPLFSLEVKKTP